MDDILQVRAPAYNFYVLKDKQNLYLIDGGFIGGWFLLERALRKMNWQHLKIKGILVTHGHLDHIFNLRKMKEKTNAWIAAPKDDVLHYQGIYPYRSLSKVCGWMEGIGRKVLRFKEFIVDQYLEDGDIVDIWDGLIAVHLPGHTIGHMGFYSVQHEIIFSGDLYASYWFAPHWPPTIFNSCPELIEDSRRKLLRLNPKGVYPNHGDKASPEIHLQRLKKLKRRDNKANAADLKNSAAD